MRRSGGSSSSPLDAAVAIRDGATSDRVRLVELWLALIEHHRSLDPGYAVPERLAERLPHEVDAALERADCLLLVAESGGELVGFLSAEAERARAWIHELYVVPERRRLGVGRALVRGADAWLETRAPIPLCVRVESANRDAWRFWRWLGFAERAGDDPDDRALWLERAPAELSADT